MVPVELPGSTVDFRYCGHPQGEDLVSVIARESVIAGYENFFFLFKLVR